MDRVFDYAKIGVIAFVGVFVINHLLARVGLDSFKA